MSKTDEIAARLREACYRNDWPADGRELLVAILDERDRLWAALAGMIHEWDKMTRYGSPLAKAANESVARARDALEGKANDT